MSLSKSALLFIEAAEKMFGAGSVLTREGINAVCEDNNVPYPYWFVNKTEYRVDRGRYKLPNIGSVVMEKEPEPETEVALVSNVMSLRQPKLVDDSDVSIPEQYPDYVPFGFYNDLRNIVKSRDFYPVFITGLSGNGKTLMVEQVCASLKRECLRVNISIETDESDLLGGPTLVNGNVVNRDGPVLQAMKKGAILLIDEVDRGSNKLMCLQGILEEIGRAHV